MKSIPFAGGNILECKFTRLRVKKQKRQTEKVTRDSIRQFSIQLFNEVNQYVKVGLKRIEKVSPNKDYRKAKKLLKSNGLSGLQAYLYVKDEIKFLQKTNTKQKNICVLEEIEFSKAA